MDCDFYETGAEPEFFATSIAKFEPLDEGLIRLYLATKKRNTLRLEYTVIIPRLALIDMARMCLFLATESHNGKGVPAIPAH